MGITSSKDVGQARYQLYEDHSRLQVNSITVSKLPSSQHTFADVSGSAPQLLDLQVTRAPDNSSELVFEANERHDTDRQDSGIGAQRRSSASGILAGYSAPDHLQLSWICDPAAQRKTARTSFLLIALREDQELNVLFDVSLSDPTLRASTLSIACAASPEELGNILADRKRNNVCLCSLV
jgi:hypothetical protein